MAGVPLLILLHNFFIGFILVTVHTVISIIAQCLFCFSYYSLISFRFSSVTRIKSPKFNSLWCQVDPISKPGIPSLSLFVELMLYKFSHKFLLIMPFRAFEIQTR